MFKPEKLNAQPTLYIFCGLPGSGKTTTAKRISAETGAVRMCPDEWLTDLELDLFDEELRTRLEKRLWRMCLELLRLGNDVILENGLWSKAERDEKRQDVEGMAIDTEIHYMDVPFEELLRRIEIRNVSGGYGTVPLTRANMESYAPLFQAPDKAELALFTRAVVHRPEPS